MSDDAGDNTSVKHRNLLPPWQPGQSGNPAGRPQGSRNKLAEVLLAALVEDFERDGVAAVVAMRTAQPGDYIRVIASLCPKEFKIDRSDDIDEDELNRRLRSLAQFIGSEIGTAEPVAREETPDRPKQAGKLPPVH